MPLEFSDEFRESQSDQQAILVDCAKLLGQIERRANQSLVLASAEHDQIEGMAQVIARAHVLRLYDLCFPLVASLESQAGIAAHLVLRAIYETFAALVYAKRKFDDCLEKGETDRLRDEEIPHLVFGNRYVATHADQCHPKSKNLLTWIGHAEKYLKKRFQADGGDFSKNYDLLSEFAHPTQGSIDYYQVRGDSTVEYAPRPIHDVGFFLGELVLYGSLILEVADELAEFEWPE